MNYHQLMFRPGTWDADIWKTVTQEDEYRLGDFRFNRYRGATVIDVGAHVGAFTFNALNRGATRVVAVEADEENLYYLRHNVYMALGAVDRVVLLGAAVSGRCSTVVFPPMSHPNTGGRAVTDHQGLDVDQDLRAAVPFHTLIDLAVPGGSPTLVKLDCEGSEWDILEDLGQLRPEAGKRVLNWVGEYHLAAPAARGRGPADLCELFGKLDCSVKIEPTGDGIGLFWAWRNCLPGFLQYRGVT